MELVKKNKPKKILKYRFADFSISKKTVKQLNFLGYHYATYVQQKSFSNFLVLIASNFCPTRTAGGPTIGKKLFANNSESTSIPI